MNLLSNHLIRTVIRSYRERYGIRPRILDTEGRILNAGKSDEVNSLPVLIKGRHDAIREAVRWGEAYTFFLMPGVLSWVVPIVHRESLHGALTGGEVVTEEDFDLAAAVNYLTEAGCERAAAQRYTDALPVWPHERPREAADYLYQLLYDHTRLRPLLLRRNNENARQQRQIAEEIQQRKVAQNRIYPFDQEQMLLSLIRVGDKAGARKLLNKMLAAMFLYSPKVYVVQARAIEMLGYLVRTAIEDSPMLRPLLENHRHWIEEILEADDFERLCEVLRNALDEFMNRIYLQGYNRSNAKVREIMNYLAEHYTEPISLDDVAQAVNLSRFRAAHLVKEVTGKTILQHVKRMRVQKARELLDQSERNYADIAYELGFSDQSYFIKQFRELTGTTPARYRHRR
ncbi:helix-turn-helix domain-containing protein [Kiritimatiella glycovorans]|uniref:AraC family transcriptional regulator n=1 Tax=Kiritimatiella glycovorans TaxID=1307763 RepID=A0A0G3END5_9BACT|nr:helix-turn-helix domain-containing protein [Kiritimatiella glycovorans]AKJ65659.1 AraC family transcriptional regulator [Kiritimatiella glycovorans]